LAGAGEVLSLLVPAGSYALSAKVSVTNFAETGVSPAFCVLSTGDISNVVLGAWLDDDKTQVISLLDDATFAAATAITLTCTTNTGEATNGVLSAIQVTPQAEPK
jgi:hypothetical protein